MFHPIPTEFNGSLKCFTFPGSCPGVEAPTRNGVNDEDLKTKLNTAKGNTVVWRMQLCFPKGSGIGIILFDNCYDSLIKRLKLQATMLPILVLFHYS